MRRTAVTNSLRMANAHGWSERNMDEEDVHTLEYDHQEDS